jgi:hypothetical protein
MVQKPLYQVKSVEATSPSSGVVELLFKIKNEGDARGTNKTTFGATDGTFRNYFVWQLSPNESRRGRYGWRDVPAGTYTVEVEVPTSPDSTDRMVDKVTVEPRTEPSPIFTVTSFAASGREANTLKLQTSIANVGDGDGVAELKVFSDEISLSETFTKEIPAGTSSDDTWVIDGLPAGSHKIEGELKSNAEGPDTYSDWVTIDDGIAFQYQNFDVTSPAPNTLEGHMRVKNIGSVRGEARIRASSQRADMTEKTSSKFLGPQEVWEKTWRFEGVEAGADRGIYLRILEDDAGDSTISDFADVSGSSIKPKPEPSFLLTETRATSPMTGVIEVYTKVDNNGDAGGNVELAVSSQDESIGVAGTEYIDAGGSWKNTWRFKGVEVGSYLMGAKIASGKDNATLLQDDVVVEEPTQPPQPDKDRTKTLLALGSAGIGLLYLFD